MTVLDLPAVRALLAAGHVDLVIETELTAAGLRAPELAIGAWALPTILEHGDDAQRDGGGQDHQRLEHAEEPQLAASVAAQRRERELAATLHLAAGAAPAGSQELAVDRGTFDENGPRMLGQWRTSTPSARSPDHAP